MCLTLNWIGIWFRNYDSITKLIPFLIAISTFNSGIIVSMETSMLIPFLIAIKIDKGRTIIPMKVSILDVDGLIWCFETSRNLFPFLLRDLTDDPNLSCYGFAIFMIDNVP